MIRSGGPWVMASIRVRRVVDPLLRGAAAIAIEFELKSGVAGFGVLVARGLCQSHGSTSGTATQRSPAIVYQVGAFVYKILDGTFDCGVRM
jgi:hypothetical protein